jgi:hypothetical protein
MKYRLKGSKLICELVKKVGGNLLCVAVDDKNHYLSFPAEMWVQA